MDETNSVINARIDMLAALGVAARPLREQDANDLRPQHIAQCREYLHIAGELLDVLAHAVDASVAEEHERELQRRHDALTRSITAYPGDDVAVQHG